MVEGLAVPSCLGGREGGRVGGGGGGTVGTAIGLLDGGEWVDLRLVLALVALESFDHDLFWVGLALIGEVELLAGLFNW